MASTSIYKIHPAIGVARVGDADPDHYFIGPETPGVPANWDFKTQKFLPFKFGAKVRRQAARFRIWEYVEKNGQHIPQREITLADVEEITWTVHLANRKASFFQFHGQSGESDNYQSNPPLRNANVSGNRAQQLDIDEGPKDITAVKGAQSNIVEFKNSKKAIPIESLGQLRTDDQGRLLVIPGRGQAASPNNAKITTYANNDNWFDDLADGPVTATITLKSAQTGEIEKIVVEGAWVLVGPPDFAPAIGNIVTLYDRLYDIAVRELSIAMINGKPVNGIYDEYEYTSSSGTLQKSRGLKRLAQLNALWRQNIGGKPGLPNANPSFTEEIFPILLRAYSMRWVYQPLQNHHTILGEQFWSILADNATSGTSASLRQTVFARVRNPDNPFPAGQPRDFFMPRVYGDDYDHLDHPEHFLTLTRTQYALLEQWSRGQFQNDWVAFTMPAQEQITPEGLDRAALENCLGGGFHPGIEVSWLVRKKEIYAEPFRIKYGASLPPGPLTVGAGFLTQQMGVPWQADPHDCFRMPEANSSFAWWPGQRPDDVYQSAADAAAGKMVPWNRNRFPDYLDWVNKWSTLHFIVKEGNDYIEQPET